MIAIGHNNFFGAQTVAVLPYEQYLRWFPAYLQHNRMEYGLMAAYAEGLGILRAANIGTRAHAADAETTPLRVPKHYQYDLNLPTSQKCGGAAAWLPRGFSI